jgi:diguanylate cyclase (GGDEF)-like protein
LLLLVGVVQRVRYAAAQARAARQVMEGRNDELSRFLDAGTARNKQVHGLSELSRFLQSSADMDEAVRLLEQGLPSLLRATSGAFYIMAASRNQLRQQSIRDVLTGLYNRRFLEESAHREVLRAIRLHEENRHQGLALMMIDVDHFKHFNDEHGHDVGDRVLRAVADVLTRQTRSSDVAARFGGEEFTVVLADMPAAQAADRAELLRVEVEKLSLESSGLPLDAVTISVGVAQFPTHGRTWEELLHSADRALYEAKSAGRNRVVVASLQSLDPVMMALRLG